MSDIPDELKAKLREILKHYWTRESSKPDRVIERIDQAYKEAGYHIDKHISATLPKYMSGQEFCSRFEKEINSLKSPDLDDWKFTHLEILEAAKRAAGISDE